MVDIATFRRSQGSSHAGDSNASSSPVHEKVPDTFFAFAVTSSVPIALALAVYAPLASRPHPSNSLATNSLPPANSTVRRYPPEPTLNKPLPTYRSPRKDGCPRIASVARYPQWFLAAAVPAWAFTAFAATWTAKRVGMRGSASPSGRGREFLSGRGNPASILIGLLLTLAVIFNVSMLPYPVGSKSSPSPA